MHEHASAAGNRPSTRLHARMGDPPGCHGVDWVSADHVDESALLCALSDDAVFHRRRSLTWLERGLVLVLSVQVMLVAGWMAQWIVQVGRAGATSGIERPATGVRLSVRP